MAAVANAAPITGAAVSSYTVPTDAPESDGTLAWESTTLVLVELQAGGHHGLGYSYADTATEKLIRDKLLPLIEGRDALAVNERFMDLVRAIRNLGRPGIASMAISAVDAALWDLKARLLGVPLAILLGRARDRIPAYGSGGFTSYSLERLGAQLGGWAVEGFLRVKMKIGREPGEDLHRIEHARRAIGGDVELFVDANGAYSVPQAIGFAETFRGFGVSWFEEPVSSDDLAGLARVRASRPGGMAITAGEYGYDLFYFRRMLEAGAVDVLQADATRCGGVTGFLATDALCDAFGVPLSAHCAPALHLALCCAARRAVHLEYFHDHARIEQMLFDGAPRPEAGDLRPDLTRPGLGLEFKRKDAECFRN